MNDTDQPIVAVIDDDESVRESLRGLLETISLKVALFSSVEAFLDVNPPILPSCIVLDVRLPGASGFELQKQLIAADVDTPIVFITGHGDIPMCAAAMKAGAVDFLGKPFRDDELLQCVKDALIRSAEQRRLSTERDEARRLLDLLTPREFEVMQLVITGMLNKQIAGELGTAEKTVKVHRGRVMEKLGVTSVAELVRVTQRACLVPGARRKTKVQ